MSAWQYLNCVYQLIQYQTTLFFRWRQRHEPLSQILFFFISVESSLPYENKKKLHLSLSKGFRDDRINVTKRKKLVASMFQMLSHTGSSLCGKRLKR